MKMNEQNQFKNINLLMEITGDSVWKNIIKINQKFTKSKKFINAKIIRGKILHVHNASDYYILVTCGENIQNICSGVGCTCQLMLMVGCATTMILRIFNSGLIKMELTAPA